MLSATARTNIRAVHNFFALRAVATGKPRSPQQIRACVKVSTGLLFSTAVSTALARARRPVRSFETSSPRPFQKRPMKPAHRASSMCRKTLTTEIQSGTSNVSTSDSSPCSLSAPQPARKAQRICPMEQYNLAKFAALLPVRLLAHFPEKKDAHTHDPGGGRDAPLNAIGRPASFTGMRPGLSRPMRGIDGGVGWKASRCAISWAPAGRRRRSRGGMAFQDLVNREASPSFFPRASASATSGRRPRPKPFSVAVSRNRLGGVP